MIDTTQLLTGSQYWFMHAEAPALAAQMKREFMESRERFLYAHELPEPEPIASIYDYDPILGLRYYSSEPHMLNLNINGFPKMKIELDRVLEHLKRHKVMIINTSKRAIDNCGRIFSNF